MVAPCRILLIEDDLSRIERLRSWMPQSIRLVVATSAGMAMGTLKRDGRGTYAALMLDHDLQQQAATTADATLSGSDLVNLIIQHVGRDAAMLVHSMNSTKAAGMEERLNRAGFWVTRIPMDRLTKEAFCDWVADVEHLWADRSA